MDDVKDHMLIEKMNMQVGHGGLDYSFFLALLVSCFDTARQDKLVEKANSFMQTKI